MTESIPPVQNSISPAPLTNLQQISQKISDLQVQLQAQSPQYMTVLYTIHKALQEDEATAHLLTDEQIGVIVRGLTQKKGIVIAEREVKKRIKKDSVDLMDLL